MNIWISPDAVHLFIGSLVVVHPGSSSQFSSGCKRVEVSCSFRPGFSLKSFQAMYEELLCDKSHIIRLQEQIFFFFFWYVACAGYKIFQEYTWLLCLRRLLMRPSPRRSALCKTFQPLDPPLPEQPWYALRRTRATAATRPRPVSLLTGTKNTILGLICIDQFYTTISFSHMLYLNNRWPGPE